MTNPASGERVPGAIPLLAMTRRPDSNAERALLTELKWLKLPIPVREYRFALPRKWRFDFAWPELLLAVEVEGGGYIGGRHTRGKGLENDCEKYAEALCLGWRVLRVTPKQVISGEAIAWLEKLLLPF